MVLPHNIILAINNTWLHRQIPRLKVEAFSLASPLDKNKYKRATIVEIDPLAGGAGGSLIGAIGGNLIGMAVCSVVLRVDQAGLERSLAA